MKRAVILGGIYAWLAAGGVGTGASVGGSFLIQGETMPGRSFNIVKEYEGGKRACAIVSGIGLSYLGLYAYDANGNCIARDDRAKEQTSDDAAVDWYPPRTGRYSIEIKCLAGSRDPFAMAIQ